MKATEGVFEQAICASLVTDGGYQDVKVGTIQGAPKDFDVLRHGVVDHGSSSRAPSSWSTRRWRRDSSPGGPT